MPCSSCVPDRPSRPVTGVTSASEKRNRGKSGTPELDRPGAVGDGQTGRRVVAPIDAATTDLAEQRHRVVDADVAVADGPGVGEIADRASGTLVQAVRITGGNRSPRFEGQASIGCASISGRRCQTRSVRERQRRRAAG